MAISNMSGMWQSMEALGANLMAREVEFYTHILTLSMVEISIMCLTIMK